MKKVKRPYKIKRYFSANTKSEAATNEQYTNSAALSSIESSQEQGNSDKARDVTDSDGELDEAVAAEPEHPLDIKRLRTDTAPDTRRLFIILEHAPLEAIKVSRKAHELATCERHSALLSKRYKDVTVFRPDIVHQCLLMLLDSPLNRAGLLRVFIHTRDNVLIDIHPQTRIPRTYDRFAGLFVQLLDKQKIRASNSSLTLLKLVRNPVTDHLPVGTRVFGTSVRADYVHARELVPTATSALFSPAPAAASSSAPGSALLTQQLAIVIGAMAHGSLKVDYIEKTFSISRYPLSAALACSKICTAFEDAWSIT
jgi:rRNA small subunit pseudouridine methyltransferase Nep1